MKYCIEKLSLICFVHYVAPFVHKSEPLPELLEESGCCGCCVGGNVWKAISRTSF